MTTAARPRRVLVVSGYLPYPPTWGAGMRVYQLVRELAVRHEVTLLCQRAPDQSADAGDLAEVCAEVRVVTRRPVTGLRRRARQAGSLASARPFLAAAAVGRELQAALDDCLAARTYDLVQLESSALGLLRLPDGIPVVIDEHNVESEVLLRAGAQERSVLRRAFNRVEAAKTQHLELQTWRRSAGCAVPAERDLIAVRSRAPHLQVAVVPNAVDADVFRPQEGPDAVSGASLLFVGLLHYRPNVDAVRRLVLQMLPELRRRRPDVRLTVVGAGPEAELEWLRRHGVIATGLVPDVRVPMADADCVVVPIAFGGGTRLKVLEALAMARPVVSTTVGAEGIDVRHEQHLLLADDDQVFVDQVCRVLENPDLARRLGRAGRERVVDAYSWGAAALRLQALHDRVLGATTSCEIQGTA